MSQRRLTLAIQWQRFGPYHIARLEAVYRALQPHNIRVVGIETASSDSTYLWKQEASPTAFERFVALPGRIAEDTPPVVMWKSVWALLDRLKPDVVAVAGFSTVDAFAFLIWCRLHHRPAILMSESKWDDKPRAGWKEGIKSLIVRQFSAALCGGTPHRDYIMGLGMQPERIFLGYDVVDNDYFCQRATLARKNPSLVRHLPGLQDPRPFFLASARFIQRKNLRCLLWAYSQYRQRIIQLGGIHEAWRLVILGDGEEREELRTTIDQENLHDVYLPGFRQIDELPAYYGLASAFIHPALQEQWGLVVNEAMAAGLPVLVSQSCGCVRDLIIDGVTGFTFDPRNTAELAELMFRVSTGQYDLQAIALNAQKHIDAWGPDRFAAGIAGALQAVAPKALC